MKAVHPGELIKETIDNLNINQDYLAKSLLTTRKTINAIINGRQSISYEMAHKLALAFSNTTPEFWLDIQRKYDLAILDFTNLIGKVKKLW